MSPHPAPQDASDLPESRSHDHPTVTRVTTILEAVARERRGLRLAELARLLDAPKSSVHGLVKGLVATGYLVETDGTYRLGPAVGALLAPARPTLVQAARPAMEELQRQCDETVALCTLVGESVVYVDLVESTQPIRYSAPLRTRRPLYPTSAGKCFLAQMRDSRLELYLARFEPARREAIRSELREVKAAGVAYNRGETVPDVSAAASPIAVAGRAVACINVAGPTFRMEGKLPAVRTSLAEATRKVAERLGVTRELKNG